MTQQEYEQKRHDSWIRFKTETMFTIDEYVFYAAFDRAYALGREKETITQEEIEKASLKYILNRQQARHDAKREEEASLSDFDNTLKAWDAFDMVQAYEDGANFALGKQEKDAEKTSALTDKEVYALESAISELESLMDGTLDEDYHKENKSIINALKRIIKKYEK